MSQHHCAINYLQLKLDDNEMHMRLFAEIVNTLNREIKQDFQCELRDSSTIKTLIGLL